MNNSKMLLRLHKEEIIMHTQLVSIHPPSNYRPFI